MAKFATRRFTGAELRLVRRSWEDVAQELEEYLRKLLYQITGGIPAGFNNVTPTNINANDVGSPGTEGSGWAAADHTHDVDTDTAVGLANANAEGTSGALARADHTHKRDVRVKRSASDVGTRNALNLSTDFLATDNAGGDRVDISLNAAGPVESDLEFLAWVL